eukprot:TRINITY_DN23245_c0_g1_i1.p1 TRINITY_DN23245_c0_g1~~TRINITY_DN23245_c0_g1_i1.p1  ORF type:complete len:459 (-),score=132.38 TRINITY_DN23245_c0_g1_i1:559-1935(-)
MLREERRKEELRIEAEQERQRKKRELEENIAAMVVAAFDNEIDEVMGYLKKGVPVDALNRRGVSALSEAACGGAVDVVSLLVGKRGDPNMRCEFGRSPLWRASYQGHASCVQALLEAGGDPRMGSDNAELPVDVAPSKEVIGALETWDVSRTDKRRQDYEEWAEAERKALEKQQAKALQSADKELDAARSLYIAREKELAHMKAELRRRILDHDMSLTLGKPKWVIEQLKQNCQANEARIAEAERKHTEARARLDNANVQRLIAAERADIQLEDDFVGRTVLFRDLDDVLIRDIGDRIRNSSRWPLLIDPGECVMKFLMYSGNSVLNFWDAAQMEPDHVRRALLSMLRTGGVLAVNLVLFGAAIERAALAEPFEDICPGLFALLLNRGILAPAADDPKGLPYFHSLVRRDIDGDTFETFGFGDDKVLKFKFVVITSSTIPHEELLAAFEPVRISMQQM